MHIIAPSNTPKPIVEKVNAIINGALAREKTQDLPANQAIFFGPLIPAEMNEIIESDLARWP